MPTCWHDGEVAREPELSLLLLCLFHGSTTGIYPLSLLPLGLTGRLLIRSEESMHTVVMAVTECSVRRDLAKIGLLLRGAASARYTYEYYIGTKQVSSLKAGFLYHSIFRLLRICSTAGESTRTYLPTCYSYRFVCYFSPRWSRSCYRHLMQYVI